ncbi:type II secretion system protein [bacterium]|nr:type II secretion system protein [bacterium]
MRATFKKINFTFAESSTHKGMPPVLAKTGFTLAEVLITLGIIGVVAAMTIPNLIANTRAHQYRAKFKKAISSLSQAARLSQSLYGYDFAGLDTQCSSNGGSDHPDSIMSVCALFNGTLTGATYYHAATDIKLEQNGNSTNYTAYTPYITSYIASMSNLTNAHAYVLADGTIVAFSPSMGTHGCTLNIGQTLASGYTSTTMASCVGFIDVNGPNLPNKEVSCSSGSNKIEDNNCIVKNDAQHMTDIFPVRFHDGIVEPATAAARYVLKTAK